MSVRDSRDWPEYEPRHDDRDDRGASDHSYRRAEARGAGDPSPEDLERLVAMLAKRDTQPDDRLTRALEGLARWTENARALPAEPPAPRRREEAPRPAEPRSAEPRSYDDRRAADPSGVPDELQSRLTDYARSIGGRERAEPRPAAAPPIASLRSALAEIAARQKALDEADAPPAARRESAPRAPQPAYDPAPARDVRAAYEARDRAPAPRPQPEPRRDERPYAPEPRRDERAYAPAPRQEPRQDPRAEPRRADDRPAPRREAPAPRSEPVPPRVFQELRSELDRLGQAVSGLPTRTEIDRITREMGQIASRLNQDRPARLDRDSLSAIDSLVAEVDRMRAGAPSPQMIGQLAEEVNAISARLEVLGPRNASAIEALSRRIDDVRGELDQFPRGKALEAVASEIQTVLARLEAQERVAAPTRDAVVGLSNHVLSLDDKIAALADAATARESSFERANSEIRAELDGLPRAEAVFDLGRQIDALTEGLKSRSAIGPALKAVEGLAGKVDALDGKIAEFARSRHEDAGWFAEAVRGEIAAVARPSAIEGLGSQIESLTRGLLEQRDAPQPAIEDIGRRIEGIDERLEDMADRVVSHGATFSRIEDVVRAFAADRRDDAPAVDALTDRVDGLGERVESLASATRARAAAFDRIEESVRSIAEQLLASRAAPAGAPSSPALEAEVLRVVEKLEQNDERIEDLHAAFSGVAARIERTCADLGMHAAESAIEAARRALGPEPHPASTQIEDEIARALDDLRASAAQSERRSAETLEAVRDTLDRLLDRIPAQTSERPVYFEDAARESEPEPRRFGGAPMVEAARNAARFEREEEPAPAPRAPRADAFAAFSQAQAELPPDHPLEPGFGRQEASSAPNAASFIAAARRAAAQTAVEEDPIAAVREKSSAPGRFSGVFAQLKARRRPLLLGLAAALVVLAALYAASGMTSHEETAPPPAPVSRAAPLDDSKYAALEARPAARYAEPATQATEAPSRPEERDKPMTLSGDIDPPRPSRPAEAAPAIEAEPAAPARSVAEVAPARAPARDLTSFAFSQPQEPTGRSAAWKAGEPVTTGSLGRGPTTELPDRIGGPTLRLRAASGDPAAQLEVAERLLEGRNVEADAGSAALWLEKAAGQGLAPAQQRLGSLYEKGRGVPRDVGAARRLYEQAAASGNVRAMHNLGVIHAEGGLGKPDFAAATIWFRMAAERGLVDSQYNLAVLETRGLGGKRDLADAYKWFALAADQGDDDAGKKRDEVGKALGAGIAGAKAEAAGFRAKPVDAAANETAAPAGGWDRPGDKRASAQPR